MIASVLSLNVAFADCGCQGASQPVAQPVAVEVAADTQETAAEEKAVEVEIADNQ